jgi:hypothetical protein
MTSANELVLNFLVNSTWQIAAIFVLASVGTYFLKNSSAHYRHIVWVTAAGYYSDEDHSGDLDEFE